LNNPLTEKLKVSYSVSSPIGSEVHPECKEAVLRTAKLLESMGFIVEEKEVPVDGKRIAKSYMNLYFGEVAAALTSMEEILGRKAKFRDVEPSTWILGLLGKYTSAEEFVLNIREWDKASFLMDEFHRDYDFYMTPATAYPPARIGELDITASEKRLIALVERLKLGPIVKKSGLIDELIEKSLKRTLFTQLANLTGQPAMSVPLHLTESGLPIGVQFMAAKGREDLLFRLAGMLEQTENWTNIKENPFFQESYV
jgi:amidase